jgi:hypothetical protein
MGGGLKWMWAVLLRQIMYVRSNTEARSSNHCCCGKVISITYSWCVYVALVKQHVVRTRCIMLLYVARLAVPYIFFFPHYLTNRQDFNFKMLLKIKRVL